MKDILQKLTALIEKNKTYIVDGYLNRNLLAVDARKYDPELLNLLQKDKELKEHFFAATDGGLVFKKDVFLQFIMNKEFLPDSYTKYKIKIGLGADDGSLLSEHGDVVLNWPYKDAILEGGQDKEDQKRSEVFFNEVLAPYQISRLLDDKVFTNWKRYDKDGEHDLDEIKDDDNLIIKGNNLVVLHSLMKRYAGKVKLIYIDPPYNTGSDSFGYNDNFNHSTWLTFMKNRIEAARDLLKPDGVFTIHCDDNEQAYLKVLCDEIFGRQNFINSIAFKTINPNGVKTAHAAKTILKVKEYILVYKMSEQVTIKPQYAEMSKFDEWYEYYIEGGLDDLRKAKVWKLKDFCLEKSIKFDLHDPEFRDFMLKNSDRIFQTIGDKRAKEDQYADGGVYFYKNDPTYFIFKRRLGITLSKKIKDIYGEPELALLLGDFWDDIRLNNLYLEGGVSFANAKKSEFMMHRILDMFTRHGDIVLDYHLGSGTTAAVAHKMGRQYIGVEQLHYGENDSLVRLQNVIAGDPSGISSSVSWQGGGSFVYANIMNNSNKFRKRVEAAKNDTDYLQLLKEATSSSFLSYRVDPKKLNEDEFKKLSPAEKRRLLLEIIDNNTLYVNYEDINDPIFKVSEKDKEFNKKLYEKK